ncbi:hypothetical protein SAMN04488063_2042 [Halopelagius inordinatus]|uniref:Halobacterial output domain-containing protein n=2 Tax=Halopelagius inordinatus TaxID=553467 RepID=A0A1I2RTA1_9EURY|nr:hypothetical protein SAMN04488063_2042 [Halopelagius inordinatus]
MGNGVAVNESNDHAMVEFDPGDPESIVAGIVDAVSAVAEIDPVEMEPLYRTVDPDALSGVLRPPNAGRPRQGDIRVSFEMLGLEVTVWSYGRVHVSE